MSYDPNAPARLTHIQEWFGGTITQYMEKEIFGSEEYINATQELSSEDRMRLYNHSYWIRLLNALHEEYPFLSRLFGKEDFDNTISIPYLTAYPPTHWSLNLLGKNLFAFLKKSYHEKDRDLVLKTAEIDWVCQQCFFAVAHPPIDLTLYTGEKAEELLDIPLRLQSHVYLLQANGHFMLYREAFLKETHDFWLKNDFPPLEKEKTYHFILFRNHILNMEWDELEPDEFTLLQRIHSGLTIDQALDTVEADEQAAFWVQKWLIRGWLTRLTE